MPQLNDETIRRLSYRPQEVIDAVITIQDTSPVPTINPTHRENQPSLGALNKLPVELLHACFDYLDVLTLQRFSRVSVQARNVVSSFPRLEKLHQIIGSTLRILAQAQILHLHSVNTLYVALLSDRCIVCNKYGFFLSLLQAERGCFDCVAVKKQLWVIALPMAKACFRFTEEQSASLPVMRSFPGEYHINDSMIRRNPIQLTSLQAARTLAIKVHGSLEELLKPHTKDPTGFRKHRLWEWYRQVDDWGFIPDDPYGGMGAVFFPTLLDGEVDYGHWCRGCCSACGRYLRERLDPKLVARLVPSNLDPKYYLWSLRERAWSISELLEHVKSCPWVTGVSPDEVEING